MSDLSMFSSRAQSSWESIPIGSAPYAEETVQVDPKVDYMPAMKAELKRFKELLEETFPVPEGVGVRFKIEWNSHDFGRYGEVVVMYDADDEAALDFALLVESGAPQYWPENDPDKVPSAPSAQFAALIQEEHERLNSTTSVVDSEVEEDGSDG